MIQKIPIDGGFTCPNRDGYVTKGGCSFCDNRTFSPAYCRESGSITDQIEAGKRFFARKGTVDGYVAYFQAYSGTYAPVEVLRARYDEALSVEGVVGIVIGTRPDCLGEDVLDLLSELNERTSLVVEVGVESCYDRTLKEVNRGHDFECTKHAIRALSERGIKVGAHIIVGLPGESRGDILMEAVMLSELPINSLKIHQLQIVKNTPMEREWLAHPERFLSFTAEEYADFVADFVERLRDGINVDRYVSESPRGMVVFPCWGLKPLQVERMILDRLNRYW